MGLKEPGAEIQSLIDSFVSDLAGLVASSILGKAEQALGIRSGLGSRRGAKLATKVLVPQPLRRRPGAAPAQDALSLERYERMAIERALAESEGDPIAAASRLGVGKSTVYRKMQALGIPRTLQSGQPAATPSYLMTAEPVSLRSYERLALEHALTEVGGDRVSAAKLLRISRSTLYYKLVKHGLKLPR
jgi:DNA-binding NtrC family response regulator